MANFSPNQAPISELKLEAADEFARDNTLFILVISDLHDNFSSWDEEEVQVVSRNFLAGSQHTRRKERFCCWGSEVLTAGHGVEV